MKIKRLRNILAAGALMLALTVSAVAPELPVTSVNGKEYYYYDVKKGESIYKVAKQMGVSTSDITSANPQALDGLRAGMRIYIPVEQSTSQRGMAESVEARQVGQSADRSQQSDKSQPVGRRDEGASLKEKMPKVEVAITETPKPQITESEEITEPEVPAKPVPAVAVATKVHKVKRGESLYGIARGANMTIAEVIQLNPSAANGVSPGDELRLYDPNGVVEVPSVANRPAAEDIVEEDNMYGEQKNYSLVDSERRISERDTEFVPIEETDSTWANTNYDAPVDTFNVVVMLPFMLEQEEPSKSAQLFTEFYEGLLLAAKEVASQPDAPHIVINTFDTAASVDTIAAIMQMPEVGQANVIIGPDNEEQLARIATGMSADTYLFNAFNVKSQLYRTYPNVIQANAPHGDLYSEAVEEFMKLYPESTPVFLARIDGQGDKDAFVSLLKERLDSVERGFEEITFRNLLQVKDLNSLSDSVNYVFVPLSGQRAEFAKITEGLKRFAALRPEMRTDLFGYPEWITFRGDYFARLGENQATIYTRFYASPTDPARTEIENEFKNEYGVGMLDAAPVQGLLGYDSGMYLLGALKENRGNFKTLPGSYVGVQSAFKYDEPEEEGEPVTLVNRAIFIVTFGPNGFIDKQVVL